MYKVFHMLVPRGGLFMIALDAARFTDAWNRYAAALGALAEGHDGFRFYTRTPRTEPDAEGAYPGDTRYGYEGVDTLGFDTLQNAIDFRAAARRLDASFLDDSSAWLVAEEHLEVNGAPKGPIDTGPGIHAVTSMRRRRGMQPTEFRRHWADGVKHLRATQGLSRFAANPLVEEEYAGDWPPVDGVVEAWFRTPADMRACFTDPVFTGVHQAHNRKFVDTRSFFTLMCRNAEQWVSGAASHFDR